MYKEKEIRDIYSKNVQREWNRLVKSPFHKLEFDTTMFFLKKYLPKKGLILDVGGGPGRYAIELAKEGYNIILLDLTPQNLEFAKRQAKRERVKSKIKFLNSSITQLSQFEDNSFEAVLCLGSPLGHIKNKKQKEIAITELARVSKKGAPIFVSVMGKLGYLIREMKKQAKEIYDYKNYLSIAIKGDDNHWGDKGYFHYFTIEELEKLITKNKIKILQKIGLDGLEIASEEQINKIYKKPSIWKNWIKIHYIFCSDPTIVNVSPHFMIVMEKDY